MNLIFFAVAMTVLIGCAGFASDTGMIWVSRARLQHSVDAAVLAAAQELPASDAAAEAEAEDVACEFATQLNDVPGMFGKTVTCGGEADVTFPEDTVVRVTAFRTVQPMFGRVLGFQDVEVWAQATARIGSIAASCLFPFFVTEAEIENAELFDEVVFRDTTSSGDAIDVASGSGPNGVRGAMEPDACSRNPPNSIEGDVGMSIGVKPGDLTQFRQGWEAIEADAADSMCPSKDISLYREQNASGQYEMSPTVNRSTCPRLVIIPVVEKTADKEGVIVGFVPFYFARLCNPSGGSTCNDPDLGQTLNKGDFWGYLVRIDFTSLTYADFNDKFGAKIVSLAD